MLFSKTSDSNDTIKPTSLKNCILPTPSTSQPSSLCRPSKSLFLFGIPKFVTATGSRKISSLSSHANVVTAHLLVSMPSKHSLLISSASLSNRSIFSETFLFAFATSSFDCLSNFSNLSLSTTKTSVPLALTFARGCVCCAFSTSTRRNSSRTSSRRFKTTSRCFFIAPKSSSFEDIVLVLLKRTALKRSKMCEMFFVKTKILPLFLVFVSLAPFFGSQNSRTFHSLLGR